MQATSAIHQLQFKIFVNRKLLSHFKLLFFLNKIPLISIQIMLMFLKFITPAFSLLFTLTLLKNKYMDINCILHCTSIINNLLYHQTHSIASEFSIHSNEAIKLRTLKQNITFKVGFYFSAKKQLPCSDLLMIQRGAKRQTGRGRKT